MSETSDGRAAFEIPGSSPAILLVHGFTGTPWEIRPLADALAVRGYACSAPLLPGHGRTPQALSSTTWCDWSDAVEKALATLLARHERAVIVGMSAGGLLALDSAARNQRRGVLGVVTLACALRVSPSAARVLQLAELAGRYLPDWYLPKPSARDTRDAGIRAQNPGYRTQPLRAARTLRVGQARARAALAALDIPLLAIHGLQDRTAPLAASIELIERAATRDSRLVVVPRSGHLVAVDADREEVARQVRAFVERVAGSDDRARVR